MYLKCILGLLKILIFCPRVGGKRSFKIQLNDAIKVKSNYERWPSAVYGSISS
jgi:hypothetical protein